MGNVPTSAELLEMIRRQNARIDKMEKDMSIWQELLDSAQDCTEQVLDVANSLERRLARTEKLLRLTAAERKAERLTAAEGSL